MPDVPHIHVTNAAWNERWPGYAAAPHRRPDWQWYAVVYGSVDVDVDDARFTLGPGDSVLLAPGTLRFPRAHGERDATGYFWVLFDKHGLHLEDVANRLLRLPRALESDRDALVAELREPAGVDAAALRQALVTRLLVGLGRHARGAEAGPAVANRAAGDELVAAVERTVAARLHEPLGRDAIAAAVHVSPAHLARVFRAETGTTLGAYVTRQRVERAKQRLLGGAESIARIAQDVGYGSYSHFAQVFKRQVGVSPSQYRRAGGKVWLRR